MGSFGFLIISALFSVTLAVDQEELTGTNITLVCSLSAVTYPTWKGPPNSEVIIQEGQETNQNYSWVSYGDNNKDLVITNAQPQYSGDYACEKGGNEPETISLNVLAKPKVLLENKVDIYWGSFRRSGVLSGIEDKNITITCNATGGNPAPNLEIKVNDTDIEDIALEKDHSQVSESDNTYTVTLSRTIRANRTLDLLEVDCVAMNPKANKLGQYSEQDTSVIYLKLKPSMHAIQSDDSVDVGKNTTVKCQADLARPAPTFSWTFDGQPLSDRFLVHDHQVVPVQEYETYSVKESVTLLKAMREDNEKELKAFIEHETLDAPRLMPPVTIKVNFGPDYLNITGNEQVFAAPMASVTLTCTTATVGAAYDGLINWRYGDDISKRIQNNVSITTTPGENNGDKASQVLTLNVTKDMDGQEITCYAAKQDDWTVEIKTSVALDIGYPPVITEPEDPAIRFAEHDNAALRCAAASKPPCNFTWYKVGDSEALSEGTGTADSNAFSLMFNDIGYNASGKYKCVATNKNGYEDEKEVEVIITESPGLPSEFIISSSDAESISFSFHQPTEAPSIHQSYFLQYRTASDGTPEPWHEVAVPAGGSTIVLKNLRYGTEYETRIKVVNKYGSERYTDTQRIKTHGVELEDGINRKDLDIAIAVSVVVTAVVIVTLVLIIYCLRRKRMCGGSSEKFELQAR